MEPSELPSSRPVVESARGWHRAQLAVLGFIGLCGVLWAGGDPHGPAWSQWLAGALVVLALVLVCLAIYLVGSVAYPVPGAGEVPAGGREASAEDAGRLRTGIRVTFAALVMLVIATLSGWWPGPAGSATTVEVRDAAGQAWCGEIDDASAGIMRLNTTEGPVALRLGRIATLRPVPGC